jgi:phosphopantetheinyl transferase (holo-ACP synthase)
VAAEIAARRGAVNVILTLTHTTEMAMAVVILEGRENQPNA